MKDMLSIRTQIVIGAAIMSLINIEMITVFATGAVDNEFDAFIMSAAIVLINFISIVPLSSFLLNTLENDEVSGWSKYERTMPVTAVQIVNSKLICTVVTIIILVLGCLILNTFCIFFVGIKSYAEILIAGPIVIGMIQLAILAPVFPFSKRYGSRIANAFYLVLLIAAYTVLGVCLSQIASNEVTAVIVRIIFYAVMPAAGVLIIASSSAAAKKLYAKEM